jgi:hypothetical protein
LIFGVFNFKPPKTLSFQVPHVQTKVPQANYEVPQAKNGMPQANYEVPQTKLLKGVLFTLKLQKPLFVRISNQFLKNGFLPMGRFFSKKNKNNRYSTLYNKEK